MHLTWTCNFSVPLVNSVSNQYVRIRSLLPSFIYNGLENKYLYIYIYSSLVLILLKNILESPQVVYNKLDYLYNSIIEYAKFFH